MATETSSRRRQLSTAMRQGEQVTPLELFFDLVFVLALTQCTPHPYGHRLRTLLAAVLLGLLPLAGAVPALATVTLVTALIWILIAYETRSYGENRARVRHEELAPQAPS